VFNADVKRIGIAINHDVFKPIKADKTIDALYCYRAHPIKNPSLMDESLKIIKKKLPKFRFHSYSDSHCSFADENHTGKKDEEIANLLNRAKVFISTSRHEGFGLPILEAFACGTPVVATRAIGNESFCIDGFNCLLIDSAEELAQAVINIFDKPKFALHLTANAKKTAQSFKWNKVIDSLEAIFKPEIKAQSIEVEIIKKKPKTYSYGIPDEEIFAIKPEHIITRDGRKVPRFIG
jgi:glycosyltransferase involved in cell wall biosynthesis